MSLTLFGNAGQTMGELARTRYQSIGQERKRQGLQMQFAVENQQRAALFDVLAQALLLGNSLATNYSESQRIDSALKDSGLKKTSGFLSDLLGTPEYTKKDAPISTESLYRMVLEKEYLDAKKGW